MITGFIIHFYITFGTNLLTGGPTILVFYCLIQYFEEKEYQTESKRNETFGIMIFLEDYHPGGLEMKSEDPRGAHEIGGRPPTGRPLSRGPLEHPPDRLLSPI